MGWMAVELQIVDKGNPKLSTVFNFSPVKQVQLHINQNFRWHFNWTLLDWDETISSCLNDWLRNDVHHLPTKRRMVISQQLRDDLCFTWDNLLFSSQLLIYISSLCYFASLHNSPLRLNNSQWKKYEPEKLSTSFTLTDCLSNVHI